MKIKPGNKANKQKYSSIAVRESTSNKLRELTKKYHLSVDELLNQFIDQVKE